MFSLAIMGKEDTNVPFIMGVAVDRLVEVGHAGMARGLAPAVQEGPAAAKGDRPEVRGAQALDQDQPTDVFGTGARKEAGHRAAHVLPRGRGTQ